LRPSSPIDFGALNCFANADAFTEHVEHMQAHRARELDGLAEVKVNMHKVITKDVSDELPWIVQQVIDPQGLRLRAEPRGVVSSP
jgi:predicted thioredoxin/glutaredoxin